MNRLAFFSRAALSCLLAFAGAASAQTVEYIHTDALGTPIAVTDANRNVIERSEYEPYGQQLSGPEIDGPGYTGHVQDNATGLTYMQQRYYDPQIGLFLSVDPVAAHAKPGRNFGRYLYADDNPYRYTDPDGRQVRDKFDMPDYGRERNIRTGFPWIDRCPFCLKEGSESNMTKRQGISATAKATDGRTEWAFEKRKGTFPANSNKCNLYVADVVRVNGANIQVVASDGTMRPPRAGEIANRSLEITNWRVLEVNERAMPGDIAAYGVPGGGVSFSGHTGIMIECDACAGKVGNMSAHDDAVYQVPGQFEGMPDVVYRRYTGD